MFEERAGTLTTLPIKAQPSDMGDSFKRWRHRHRHTVEAWMILGPSLIYYSIFFALPALVSLALSFTRWSGMSGQPVWVGLDNFRRYLTAPYYQQIILNTLGFAISILILQTLLAVLVALGLNRKILGRTLFRAAWYVPASPRR